MNNNTPSSWRARPVFISSTFLDMQYERDWHSLPFLLAQLGERYG